MTSNCGSLQNIILKHYSFKWKKTNKEKKYKILFDCLAKQLGTNQVMLYTSQGN